MHICCLFTSYLAIGVGEKKKPDNSIVCLQKLVNESSNAFFHYWQTFFLCLLYGFLFLRGVRVLAWLKFFTCHQLYILCLVYLLWPCDCLYLKRFVCRTGWLSKKPFIKISPDPLLRNFFGLSHISSSNCYDLDSYIIRGFCLFCYLGFFN